MRGILQGVETELVEKTKDFVDQYNAMKEHGASTLQELHDKIAHLSQERDALLVKVKEVTEENNTLTDTMAQQQLKPEGSTAEDQKLQASVEEHTSLVGELKQSVEELSRQNEEILSEMQMKENMTQDLKEMVTRLTEERDKMQSLFQTRIEEMQNLNDERAKEFERLLEGKERDALLLTEEKEKELKGLKKENEDEVQHLNEEMEKIEESLKEEVKRREEIASALELSIKELATEKTDLHQKLEEASSELVKAQDEKELLCSKLAAVEAQLEQETSEKHQLEERLSSATEEAEQSRSSTGALEENMNEALKNSSEEVEELRVRVDELEKERDLLKTTLEQAQGERRVEEVHEELQAHITNLEQERDMLKNNLVELVKDNEGLQKDLLELKSVSEKISEENQKLMAQVSLMTEEKEEGEMEDMQQERRAFSDQLTEKDSLISQLRSEMAALQVSDVYHNWELPKLHILPT